MANRHHGFPAASGYPQYGYLTSPIISDELCARFYCASVFGEITTTDYLDELVRGRGNQIVFRKRPKVAIHRYIKDMVLKADTLEIDYCTLTIGEAMYFNVKIDMLDEWQMGGSWDQLIDAFMEEATIQMKKKIDSEILCQMYADADCKNRGPNAGCGSSGYDMGTPGAPIQLTPANIGEKLQEIAAVLDEACIPESERFIVLPPQFKVVLSQSPWGQCCLNDMAEELFLNGKLPGDIAGFKIYISNSVSRVYDPAANMWVYNIIAGWKGATAFAMVLEKTRVHTTDRSFDKFYQGLIAYGWDTMYPEGLVHVYATF